MKLILGSMKTKNKGKLGEPTVKAWTKCLSLLNTFFAEGIEMAKNDQE